MGQAGHRRRVVIAGIGVAALVATPLVAAGAAAGRDVLAGRDGAAGRAAAPRNEDGTEVALRQARMFALRRLARTDRRLPPGRFPTVALPGRPWRTSDTSGWLAGFWPGRLWLAYELDGSPVWARRAARRQAPLAVRQDDAATHDLGFLLQTSFGRGADHAQGSTDAAVTSRAAAALASRHVPVAGMLRSWDGPNGQVTVIVDTLMNLELLFAAAERGGPAHWAELAHQHALASARLHLRPDGSTFHVVRLDEASGALTWRGTRQGMADDSTWARGQAWAVHGFTTAYRETGDRQLLEAARRVAGFAVTHAPADGVPWWDYDAPGTRRDTTAAATLAAGLIELARLDPDPGSALTWRTAGMRTLRSLVGPGYLAKGTGSRSLLMHGRHDLTYADAGVTYADYYLLEALLRVQLLPSTRPELPVAKISRVGGSRLLADLGRVRQVGAVSVRWLAGASTATRFRVQVSRDGSRWRTARGGVSSGRSGDDETYDLGARRARFVRVIALGTAGGGAGGPLSLTVRH